MNSCSQNLWWFCWTFVKNLCSVLTSVCVFCPFCCFQLHTTACSVSLVNDCTPVSAVLSQMLLHPSAVLPSHSVSCVCQCFDPSLSFNILVPANPCQCSYAPGVVCSFSFLSVNFAPMINWSLPFCLILILFLIFTSQKLSGVSPSQFQDIILISFHQQLSSSWA